MASPPADMSEYENWTPEQIMRDYQGELKWDLFVRCMEWYTSAEVEAKINAARSKPIANSNFFAEFKRSISAIAMREGHLPTVYRLDFDKRRLANLITRFGEDHTSVSHLRGWINTREHVPTKVLSANPTLQDLEAARPENAQRAPKGRETRDYWYKFAAASEVHSLDDISKAYAMAKSYAVDEIRRAKRMATRFREIEALERRGESIPQTYIPPASLQPGQQIFAFPQIPSSSSESTVAANNNKNDDIISTTYSLNAISLAQPSTTLAMAPSQTKKKESKTRLASIRVHTTLDHLHDDLRLRPREVPALSRLAFKLDLPLECLDDTDEDRARQATCETQETLAAFEAWCKEHDAGVVQRLGKKRVAAALSAIIRSWLERAVELEDEGAAELEETFLQAVQLRFEALL